MSRKTRGAGGLTCSLSSLLFFIFTLSRCTHDKRPAAAERAAVSSFSLHPPHGATPYTSTLASAPVLLV